MFNALLNPIKCVILAIIEASLAQSVERQTLNLMVRGSSPLGGSPFYISYSISVVITKELHGYYI